MTMKSLFAVGAGAVIVLALSAGSADAQGRGRGNDKNKTKTSTTVVVFAPTHHAKFRDYFVTHKWAVQPLPPGIAMNLERGKPLPPGIAKRVLPRDLVLLLPRDPAVTYYVIGDRVVAVRNGSIIDILLDVLR